MIGHLRYIASIPPINRREAEEDALKQLNHDICMCLLDMSEISARRAAFLMDVAPVLHDELVAEVREQNSRAWEIAQ